jgi:hypothetical protein
MGLLCNDRQRVGDLRSYKKSERSEEIFWNFANPLLGEVSVAKRRHEPNKGGIPDTLSRSAVAERRNFYSTVTALCRWGLRISSAQI